MNEEIDFRALIGPLRRQFKLIVSIVCVMVALSVAIGLSITPKYQATSLLYVDTKGASLLDDDVSFANAAADNSRVTSEVEIAKSDGVILDLIEQLDLVNNEEFGVKLGRLESFLIAIGLEGAEQPSADASVASVLGAVRNAIQVQRRGLTYILSVSAIAENPDTAALLANGLANSYIRRQLNSKVTNINVSLDLVRRQLEETELVVASTQTDLDNFISANVEEIARINNESDLLQLRDELMNLQGQKAEIEVQKNQILRGLGGASWVSDVSGLKTDALRALEQQRRDLTAQISDQDLNKLAVEDLRLELDSVNNQISNEVNIILDAANTSLASVDTSILQIKSRLSDKVLSDSIILPDEISAQLYRLSQQSRNTTSQYQTLLAKAQELEAEALLQIPDTRIISAAMPPSASVVPNLKLMVILAAVLGGVLAVAIAYIIENLIGGFTSVEQVEELTKLPVVGSISTVKEAVNNISVASEKVIVEPFSVYSESMRKLKMGLQIVLQNLGKVKTTKANANGNVIMVTSALPSEGKTNVAVSLARTFAFSGSKTLIIDFDLRKPSVAGRMNVSSSKSLHNVFKSEINAKTISENLVLDEISDLNALICHRSDLKDRQYAMGFKSFEQIINIARRHYDYIILDTSPIGPVADTLALAEYTDSIVFVIKWATTSQKLVLENLKLLQTVANDTKIVTVLNQIDEKRSGVYSEYSGYYFEKS